MDDNQAGTCVVCFEHPCGEKLEPCGHDCFCDRCASRFRTCPLCRGPITNRKKDAKTQTSEDVQSHETTAARPQVVSRKEFFVFGCVWCAVWLVIFIGGLVEFYYDIPKSCKEGCTVCSTAGGCKVCSRGYVNHGSYCYKHVEDMPPIEPGGGFGTSVYLVLILSTQILGVLTEVALIVRLKWRGLLPSKELIILSAALVLEIFRMLLVDVIMLREYFGGPAYQIYRVPTYGPACANVSSWSGADGMLYCSDHSNHHEDTRYYIARHMEAFASYEDQCSTFTVSSALLDFDQGQGFGGNGYNRFSRLGWVLGGQFGLIYFFATFVNEVADIIFVVPTTAAFGWRCKAFAVALEFFQLGALCPAAIFQHTDCLQYTNPLGMSLHVIRQIVTANCFLVWGFILTCVPLAVCGLIIVAIIVLLSSVGVSLFSRASTEQHALERLEDMLLNIMSSSHGVTSGFFGLAAVPTFLCGIFLGSLVVVGQCSKSSFAQALTAVALLSDVIFKVGATLITELLDYLLHLRVTRALAMRRGPSSNSIPVEMIGSATPSTAD